MDSITQALPQVPEIKEVATGSNLNNVQSVSSSCLGVQRLFTSLWDLFSC